MQFHAARCSCEPWQQTLVVCRRRLPTSHASSNIPPLQVLGTHNSYHQAPPPEILGIATPLGAWQFSHPPLAAQLAGGGRAVELDSYWDPKGGLYGQAAGLRFAGLDGWLTDPAYTRPGFKVGGAVAGVAAGPCADSFADTGWRACAVRAPDMPATVPLTSLPATVPSMPVKPHLQVMHVPDFDFRSSCILLADCLAEVRRWSGARGCGKGPATRAPRSPELLWAARHGWRFPSPSHAPPHACRCTDANPGHLPLRVYLEVKEAAQVEATVGPLVTGLLQSALANSSAAGPAALVQQPANSAQTFRDLQAELEAVFGAGGGGQLATPDSVRAALGAPADADLQQLLLHAPGAAATCPWPPLASLRGKVLAVLVLSGGSVEADAFEEAFPGLSERRCGV